MLPGCVLYQRSSAEVADYLLMECAGVRRQAMLGSVIGVNLLTIMVLAFTSTPTHTPVTSLSFGFVSFLLKSLITRTHVVFLDYLTLAPLTQ